tara:strand:+ start:12050 stop:12217 length:168 start_codon:yes stop_codon:yes gene_type:complete
MLKIYSNAGMLVHQELKTQSNIYVNVSNYKTGLYFVTLETKHGVITKRIMIAPEN